MANTIRTKLSDFSPEVREALTSELMVYYVDRLNTQNKIPEEKQGVIAQLIAKLAMGILAPNDFTAAAQTDLGVDFATAARVGREVRDVALAPIGKQLLEQCAVDIRKIVTEQPKAAAPAIPRATVTGLKPTPLTVVNLKPQQPRPVVTPLGQPGAAPQARVMQFKPITQPKQTTPKPSGSDPTKKLKVTESPSPFSLTEDEPEAQ